MDHELGVDEEVADEDQEGREDPAVKPHNQHSGQVQSEDVELNRSNFVTLLTLCETLSGRSLSKEIFPETCNSLVVVWFPFGHLVPWTASS